MALIDEDNPSDGYSDYLTGRSGDEIDDFASDTQHEISSRVATRCFQAELILFTISGFLPGEYALRVLPLIVKSMRSCRLSLSLLGQSSIWLPTFDLAGPLYGINSTLQIWKRILARGHLVNAVLVENEDLFLRRSFSSIAHVKSRKFCSLVPFPKLTKLDLYELSGDELDEVWKLPLTSLTLNYWWTKDLSRPDGPPAFAQTLRSLQTSARMLLEKLAPYCRSLQNIDTNCIHQIISNNPGLTSLTLSTFNDDDFLDLSQHTQLTRLSIRGVGLMSQARYPWLEDISLYHSDPGLARTFLQRCPALKHASLTYNWQDMIKLIEVLDPTHCSRLTLSSPSVLALDHEIYNVLMTFQLNEEFLFQISNEHNWEVVTEVVPYIRECTMIRCNKLMDGLIACPGFFTSFYALSAIEINSTTFQWNQQILFSLVASLTALKRLKIIGSPFAGTLHLESSSLCKLDLQLPLNPSNFILTLPALTHLWIALMDGEGALLQGLLDGGSRIQMPCLHALHIYCRYGGQNAKKDRVIVSCKAGHRSLTHLTQEGVQSHISMLTLENLPNLRVVKLCSIAVNALIRFRVPGECDIFMDIYRVASPTYVHQGCLDAPLLDTLVSFDTKTRSWAETNLTQIQGIMV